MTAVDLEWSAALPAIGLDELNTFAERLIRVDRKYLVRADDIPEIIASVPGLSVLDVAGARSTQYVSTYFDTPDFESYHRAGRCRRRRYKVRTRRYESGDEFLEVKWKDGRGMTHKVRRPWCSSEPAEEAHSFISQVLAGAGVPCRVEELRPSLRTSYRRSTVLMAEENARATIDFNLVCESPTGHVILDRFAIIETKAGARLTSLDRQLHRHGHRALKMSKYGVGMAATVPGLPPEKWSRTLRQLIGSKNS